MLLSICARLKVEAGSSVTLSCSRIPKNHKNTESVTFSYKVFTFLNLVEIMFFQEGQSMGLYNHFGKSLLNETPKLKRYRIFITSTSTFFVNAQWRACHSPRSWFLLVLCKGADLREDVTHVGVVGATERWRSFAAVLNAALTLASAATWNKHKHTPSCHLLTEQPWKRVKRFLGKRQP